MRSISLTCLHTTSNRSFGLGRSLKRNLSFFVSFECLAEKESGSDCSENCILGACSDFLQEHQGLKKNQIHFHRSYFDSCLSLAGIVSNCYNSRFVYNYLSFFSFNDFTVDHLMMERLGSFRPEDNFPE